MILNYCLLKHHTIKAVNVYKVWYENKAKATHIFDDTLGKPHRGGTAKLALEVGLGREMFKSKGCTHERQRPAEHSKSRLLQGAWSHFGRSARREGPRDEAEQVGKDKITPRLDCSVQFQKERDMISGIARDPSRAGSRVKGGLEGSTLEIGRWLRDRKYSRLSGSAF